LASSRLKIKTIIRAITGHDNKTFKYSKTIWYHCIPKLYGVKQN
jgi:hypothetical protein